MFARTQRLTLRPLWLDDAEAVTNAIAHQSVVINLSSVPWPYSIDDARAWLSAPKVGRDATLAILAHEGLPQPRLIGVIGVHAEGDGHELGYWLTPDAWGRGYATEAGRAMLGVARYGLGLRHLSAGHFVDNPASARVLCKLGFRPTGRVEPQFSRGRGAEVACVKLAIDLAEIGSTDADHDCRMAA
ncbi:MAG: GNAT family N-acetyltransferase [Sphingomonas sp.]